MCRRRFCIIAGRFILYKECTGGIWSAPVEFEGDALEVGRPEKLFDLPAGFQLEWGARVDRSRFLFVQLESTSTGGSLNLVKLIFSSFDELKQQVAGTR